MPAVRDYLFEFETSTTDAGLTLTMPAVQENDLILVFVGTDAPSATITYTLPSGYNTLYNRDANLATSPDYICIWKIAGASEPSSITIGANVNESYHGAILTIRDVDITNPFGNPAVFSQGASPSTNVMSFSQITTTRNDSLIIYFCNSANTAMDSLIGPASLLITEAGADEAYMVAYGVQRIAGLTPVVKTQHSIANQRNIATIQVQAPSTGATVIPPYVQQDDSSIVTTFSGLSYVNSAGSTVALPAATADTNFATTIGGLTIVDGSYGSQSNQWLLPTNTSRFFISATPTPPAMSSFENTLTPSMNLSNKNILFHVHFDDVGKYRYVGNASSGKGVWVGLRSNTGTDYKVWQILAKDSPGVFQRFIPCVVCPEATALHSAGTLNSTSVASIGIFQWYGSSGTTSQTHSWWNRAFLLEKTVICGGITSSPIGLTDIYYHDATGKVRQSSLIQGSGQLTILHDVQIGNGSDKTVLKLDNTSIEFPSQRNAAKALVTYNSIDNNCGLLYYTSANDTIQHTNSSVYSPSRYKWGFVDGSSTSATYDFNGTAVIGAGTITLNLAITMEGLDINNYTTVSATGMTFLSCSVINVPATNNSFTGFAAFNTCFLDVSTVGAGNYWVSIANPSVFTSCTFKGGTGHAIRITTPGTYTLTGNQFNSFGADGTTGAAIYNDSGGAVTLNIVNGSTPTVRNGTGATTVVNNAINLTLTGIIAGSDIVILNAGTSTERVNIDQNPTSTYVYSYTTPLEYVDVGVFKKGYVPFYIRNYQLGATSGTLPVSQVTDRNYTD